MKIKLVIIISLLIQNFGLTQEIEKTIFHLYEPSSSVSKILKWNIKDTTNQRFVVKEEIDEFNRVITIQYLVDGSVKEQNPMYGITNIKFEYEKNTIIEHYLQANGDHLTFLEDENPSYRKYFLNDKNEIIDCETSFIIKFKELSTDQLLKIEESLKFWREYVLNESDSVLIHSDSICPMDYIFGYLYSYSKMNGIFPKKSDFSFDFDIYETELSRDIINELKNKYKP